MPITTNEFKYPVLILSATGRLYVAINEDALTTLNAYSLRHGGGLTGSEVIDSNGKAARVVSTTFVSGKGRFWGYTVFLDRIIRVYLKMNEAYEVGLDEVKSKVLKIVRKVSRAQDSQYWQQPIERMSNAQTIEELINLLFPDWDWLKMFR